MQRSLQGPYTVRVPGTKAHTTEPAEMLQEVWQQMLKEDASSPAQVHHLLQHSYHEGQRNRIHQSIANDSLAPKKKQGLPKKKKKKANSGKLQEKKRICHSSPRTHAASSNEGQQGRCSMLLKHVSLPFFK